MIYSIQCAPLEVTSQQMAMYTTQIKITKSMLIIFIRVEEIFGKGFLMRIRN